MSCQDGPRGRRDGVDPPLGPVEPSAPEATSKQPDYADIAAVVSRFMNQDSVVTRVQAQLQPNVPNPANRIDYIDIFNCADAFKGSAYPFIGPTACP